MNKNQNIDISVIIVNYNVKYFLENTIMSVISSSQEYSCEIIVVDNTSSDGSEEYIRKKFGTKVDYIYNKENVGFAKANNQGLRKARGEYILILNPDTLLSKDTIPVMIDYLKKNEESNFLTCKVITPNGKIDTSCHRSFPTAWNSFSHISGLSKLFPNIKIFSAYNLLYLPENEIAEVDAISGCFMFFRRKIIDLGIYLPEEYFMYGEDIDFCYQVKKKGFKIEYVPTTEIIHYRGQSSKKDKIRLNRHFYKSMNTFVQKNYGSKYSWLFKGMLNIGIFLTFSLSMITIFLKKFALPIIDIISYFIALILAINLHNPIINLLQYYREQQDTNLTLAKYSLISIVYISIILSIFTFSKVYTVNKFSYKKFILSSFLIVLISLSLTFLLKMFAFSRIVLLLMFAFSTTLMFCWRILLLKRMKFFFRKTLIVGIDEVSLQLIDSSSELSREGVMISGFIAKEDKYLGKNVKEYPVFGNINNLLDVLKLEKIENVIFSLKSFSLQRIDSYREILEREKLDYKILPNYFKIKKGKIQYIELD